MANPSKVRERLGEDAYRAHMAQIARRPRPSRRQPKNTPAILVVQFDRLSPDQQRLVTALLRAQEAADCVQEGGTA